MKKPSQNEIDILNSAIIGFWRMGAKPVEIVGGLMADGEIHSVNYVQLIIDNYIKNTTNE